MLHACRSAQCTIPTITVWTSRAWSAATADMAPRKSGKTPARSKKQAQEAVDVVEALAGRLAQLGRRKWKVIEAACSLR